MAPARRLRRQPSNANQVSAVQTQVVILVDQLHEHLDDILRQAEQPPKEAEPENHLTTVGAGTFWHQAEVYMTKNSPQELFDDAVTLIQATHDWGETRARAYLQERLDVRTKPAGPTPHMHSTVFHWIYGQAGQWRGQPSNSEVRKLARGIAMSNFRDVWDSAMAGRGGPARGAAGGEGRGRG